MSESQWIDAAPVADVPAEDVIGIIVGARDIALYNVDGEIYATDNLCTHGHARLCDGFLEGHEIECPLHQGKFHIATGKAVGVPCIEDIRVYAVKVEDGAVLLKE